MIAIFVLIFAFSLIGYMEYEYRRTIRETKNKCNNVTTRRSRTHIDCRNTRKINKK